jgi:hypothetical protein
MMYRVEFSNGNGWFNAYLDFDIKATYVDKAEAEAAVLQLEEDNQQSGIEFRVVE